MTAPRSAPAATSLRVEPVRGDLYLDLYVRSLDTHGVGRDPARGGRAEHLTGLDVVHRSVPRARDLLARHLALRERAASVRAGVVDGVETPLQVEESDLLPRHLNALRLARSEVVALDLADYEPETGALTIRAAKGRKDRLAYTTNGSRAALAAWLQVRGMEPGPLFWPIDQAGRMLPRRMNGQSIFELLERRARRARVQRFSPHDLRRTFISDLLDAGADITTVSALAGHANVTTTARYDRRGEESRRRAAELLVVPFEV
jgi:integrase